MVSPPTPSRLLAIHSVRHALAAAALREFFGIREFARVRVVVVKGMATSSLLYAHPSERPLSDVDLRTTRRDLTDVVRIARKCGIPVDWSSAQRGSVALRIAGVDLEFESTLGPPGVCAVSIDEVLIRAVPREISPGLVAHIPELHDHALQLSLNVFKDMFLSPAWSVEDLLRIVRVTGFDHARFVALVRRARCVSAVGLVATWLAGEHPSAEWAALVAALAPPYGRRIYARVFHAARRGNVRPVLRMLVAHGGSDTLRGTVHGLTSAALGAVLWKARRVSGTLVERGEPHPSSGVVP
jgi:hypothetical protein